jgi:outer membrane receptor protein involved in Fe transport
VFNYRGPLDEESVVITNNQVISSAGREYALTVPLDRYNVFGRVEHELPGGVTLFSELFYTSSTAEVPIGYGGLGLAGLNGTVPVTNPFIPDDLGSLLASRSNPNAPFSVTYSFRNLPRIVFETEGEVGQIVAGASGELGAGWTWDVYATYGRTTTDQAISGFSLAAAQQLLSAPDGGASLCAGGLNIFGPPASISQECGDFIARTGVTESEFDQSVGEASVRGALFNLPAGALEVALGASWRRNTYSANPSDVLQAGDLVPQGRALPASGSQSVTEGFVEVLAPLLRDLPLVHKLNLNAGYRYSEYRTFGGAETYNASLDWEVTDSFRFRGGYARAIRAPSLADLFTPESLVSVTLGTPSASNRNGDPCDIRSSFRTGAAAAQVRALCLEQGVPESIIDSFTYPNSNVFPTARGNPDLTPEQADTVTFGLVWRSSFDNEWLDRAQVAVDYYNIKVDDAIGVLPFNTALTNCFNGDNVSNPGYAADNLFCSFVVRNDLGQISSASETPRINQASYETSGLDIQVDWAVGLNAIGFDESAGELQLNFLGSWLEEFVVQSFQTARKLDFAGASNGSIVPNVLPQWKSVTRLTYSNDLFDIGVRWRHLDGVQDVSRVTTTGSTTPGVESVDYYDLNGAWRISDGAKIRAGVTNLLDRDIPQVGTVPGNTDPATYDVIGRTFYLGVGVKF